MVVHWTFSLEGELHDESRLPHLHSEIDINKMFPEILAAPIQPNAEDWNPNVSRGEGEKNEGMGELQRRHRTDGRRHGGISGKEERRHGAPAVVL